MDEKPQKLQMIAIIQLVSGLLNMAVMSRLSMTIIRTLSGICTAVTMGIGVVTMICMFFPLALIPIGIFELVCGIMGLANPQTSRTMQTIGAITEIVAILFGGLISLVAGIVVLVMLKDPEVKAYQGVETDLDGV